MIGITDIQFGWATLHIGYCSFCVSYLSDLKGSIDYLLDLDIEEDHAAVRKVILEGESQGDLSLVAYLTFGKIKEGYGYIINIIWQRLYADDGGVSILRFPYKEFLREWESVAEEIKEQYIKEFVCPFDEEEKSQVEAEY